MTGIRAAIVSDLHLEIRKRHWIRDGLVPEAVAGALSEIRGAIRETAASADLVILAGDIDAGAQGLAWAAETFDWLPVVYVAGNHEFYRRDMGQLLEELRAAAASTGNVRFLEQNETELTVKGRTLRVLGATGWTDYQLNGTDRAAQARQAAESRIYDHKRIGFGGRLFETRDAARLHEQTKRWLDESLSASSPAATIVVTHHAPAPQSIEPRFQDDDLSPAFAADLGSLMRRSGPALWVHGHTHYNVDYMIARTRVVSHQWGYPSENLSSGCRLIEI